jgi:hypothetical protein
MGIRAYGSLHSPGGWSTRMNEQALSQLIILHFGAAAMTIGAIVFGLLLLLLVYITIKDHLLNFDNKETENVPPRIQFPGD